MKFKVCCICECVCVFFFHLAWGESGADSVKKKNTEKFRDMIMTNCTKLLIDTIQLQLVFYYSTSQNVQTLEQ